MNKAITYAIVIFFGVREAHSSISQLLNAKQYYNLLMNVLS